jgi:hypothetical protein
MSEEAAAEATADEATTGTETEGGERSKRAPRSMDVVALRELRRARKMFKDGEPTAEANFVVASAHVLALLDLAAAIRDGGNAGKAE